MKTSEQTAELDAALAKAQGAMSAAAKDRENPHFKQSYATLASAVDAVRAPLAANGLSLTQWPRIEEGRVVVTTRLAHTSGQWIIGELTLAPTKNDPQGIGSAITYARRYALMAACGIAPDDDDGNEASAKPEPAKRAAKPKEAPEEKAERQAKHDPSWDADKSGFMLRLGELKIKYDDLAAWQTSKGNASPSNWPAPQRAKLLGALTEGPKRDEFEDWRKERAAIQGEGA